MIAAVALAAALTLGQAPNPAPGPVADDFQPDPSWKPLGKDLWFDPQGRRLVIRAKVALRDGALEHLLCRRNTKEHEAVLATEAPPVQIHAGLILTGAEPGKPVRFQPEFKPPSGTPIAIELEWSEGGKARRADAKQWVKRQRDGKALDKDWVFAGSMITEDPITNKPAYAADSGDLITVANFPAAILDLPLASSSDSDELSFVAYTDRIPPSGTPVLMSLRPAARPAAPGPRPAPRPTGDRPGPSTDRPR